MTVIAVLPGDGIGGEILDGPLEFLRRLAADGAPLTLTEPLPYGASGWQATGSILPEETIDACRNADVVLSGAVGTHPGVTAAECPNPESALISLRNLFDLRVSVRTVWVPQRSEDVTIVRNITGGACADPSRREESDGVSAAVDELRLLPARVREVLELAADFTADAPGRRYISVDKAGVFATSRLWRATAKQVADRTGVVFDHVNVDRAAYELVSCSQLPAVIATEGIFGDILSDIVCARAGSPALCGSVTINPDRNFGAGITALFEPAHGSSPHRTGTRRSNPTGAWLALAALLDWCPDLRPLGQATRIRSALELVHRSGVRTYDLATPEHELVDMDGYNARILDQLQALQPA
ncbi:isocitrate/isopropylmalate family dehydrogenase [Rhodococcus sp. IEGM 1305]|jgi:3-isopropylmalate dehydrogenase|uniref:isocitrate/isopropylmalate family dehydrogenase n=1 Tax=Rhodococcus sp. IEGM 1305 TaxID=3047092 RepID=UPI0024B8681C|nr:isocitrate/isopropylmalate family dehydrogenase [Rhodococcus sp. IEGM 1305]MDI9949587.1 isocitrate/isopropylmalate family dehydrogenase [Rhodococcus sp. IEGM 1305]